MLLLDTHITNAASDEVYPSEPVCVCGCVLHAHKASGEYESKLQCSLVHVFMRRAGCGHKRSEFGHMLKML